MNDSRRITLERGLAAFDAAVAARRARRRAAAGAVALLAVVAGALIAQRFLAPAAMPDADLRLAARSLPDYVQLITDDEHLNVELALADACERIGRSGGRVYVVECSAPTRPGR
jgi:hypothetical protein